MTSSRARGLHFTNEPQFGNLFARLHTGFNPVRPQLHLGSPGLLGPMALTSLRCLRRAVLLSRSLLFRVSI